MINQTLVLHLKDSIDRNEYFTNHFKKIGLENYKIIDGIGHKSKEVQNYFEKNLVKTYPPCFRCLEIYCNCGNNYLRPQQVGNFLTHLKAINFVINSNKNTLIVEDDVYFHKRFSIVEKDLIAAVNKNGLNINNDSLYFIGIGCALSPLHKSKDQPHLTKKIRMSNPCYFLTPNYAKYLKERFNNSEKKVISTTSDIFINRNSYYENHTYYLSPPLASDQSHSTGKLKSEIHLKENYIKKNSNILNKKFRKKETIEFYNDITKKYFTKLLIYGHPRCGTGYISALLKNLNLDIGHEEFGKDGISSWMLCFDGKVPYSKDEASSRREHLVFNSEFAVSRNPISAIPSIMIDNLYAEKSLEFRNKKILENFDVSISSFSTNFETAIASYTYWYKYIIEKNIEIFRIENQIKSLSCILEEIFTDQTSLKITQEIIDKTGIVNASKPYNGVVYEKENIEISNFFNIDKQLLKEFLDVVDSLGYKINI